MPENEEIVEQHVHHVHEPFDKIVAGSMAIIAALLAIVSVVGQHFVTEQLLFQGKASNAWAYYQAKDIRRFTAEATRDLVSELKQTSALKTAYDRAAQKYRSDANEIQDKAREFERERDVSGRRATRFHSGEILLEIAIVFSSLAILTKTRFLFFAGVVGAIAGILIAAVAWFV